MCIFKAPSISVPDTPIPAPLPADLESAPKVESVDFGGSAKVDTETASGVKGEKSTGKSSLKVKLNKPDMKLTKPTNVGANLSL
ncbi:hypothetical protein [Vibrio phage JSF24]|nr:hypothetical protein VN4_27 [Vibrio phage N4]YP_004251277.1 hypothetical protein ViPhICP3_gp34 [Vibrio phage ICP3]ADX87520.1 hypothetical protein TU18-RWS_00140 [Vibrio phage ICP3_2009_B]ADX87568.1 hypothetical protein TU18-25_00145 [Vibrio phage ICP3_2009_A]ADX87616.1 hypothetical protein TU18-21_00145 [Vibrio phage ICP3_2008_A]ADX87663.1 hypothetical protein TU18-20_00140 [Vibrio phage ICP3_2007_A]ASU01162.1 hypothetical protein [Vibrio phage JSF25]ASV42794.1 hypothetical protein [Vibri